MRKPIVLAALALLLFAPEAAKAHFSSAAYSFKGCPATVEGFVDPITVVFYTQGWAGRSLNHVQFHAGWRNTSGSRQYFLSHSQCGEQHGQRANGGTTDTRFHTRVRRTYDGDSTWGITSTATPHYEDFVWWCGHAVRETVDGWSGFDMGRRRIYRAFSGTHHVYGGTAAWGNTRQFKQCDGQYAGSNGSVGWWRVPDWNH